MRRVSQSYREVPEPALVADAPDRRALHVAVEFFRAPAEQLDQGRAVQAIAHLKVLFVGYARKTIPGADQLAVVATVDAVADQLPQLLRNGALVLDREVGDAAPGVEPVRGGDRLRRADVDTASAGRTRSRRGKTTNPPRGPAARCACRASRCRRAARSRPPSPARNRRRRGS